jgi:photosystem II stability/assembly factor-like uncharacterized protein
MSETDDLGSETKAHEAEGSFLEGWPAMVLSTIIIGAALYSFSPRPLAVFPATQIDAQKILVTDIARQDQDQGSRLLAVGEQGTILYADDPNGPWQVAAVEPQQGSTFSRVVFLGSKTAVAVGHDAWIVRSTDAGQNWKQVAYAPDKGEPLLGIAGPFDGKLMAYGAFGRMEVSRDAGQTWQRQELVKDASAEVVADVDDSGSSDPFSDNYDPFGSFGGGGSYDDFSTRHLNGMAQASDGSLWLVGERGLIARSTNGGESWTQYESGYDGSFYGVFETQGGRILAYGMRGHVYSSRDKGESWQASDTQVQDSLFSGALADNGDILLVGATNVIIKSTNDGQSFTRVSQKDNALLADIQPISAGLWLTAGDNGLQLQGPNAPAPAQAQADRGGE